MLAEVAAVNVGECKYNAVPSHPASRSSSSYCSNNSDWNHHGNRVSTWKQGCGGAGGAGGVGGGGGGMERLREREWKRGSGASHNTAWFMKVWGRNIYNAFTSHTERKGSESMQPFSYKIHSPSLLLLCVGFLLSPNSSSSPLCEKKRKKTIKWSSHCPAVADKLLFMRKDIWPTVSLILSHLSPDSPAGFLWGASLPSSGSQSFFVFLLPGFIQPPLEATQK